ncbi:MAG: lipopolysaccharide heptosyltransferase I [Alcanivorax sp.]|nr:lipopolysaccharide heptosyltransferase I [Alcanivorax sp.]MBI55019.1 lipopolysaccharide heptosyltransferase I [Alcanivorax sp.]MBM1144242.1 lipopolysaccharide heptosyltransferase I [Alcanivorax sp. ZXX171]MBU60535.1 lipopolysaccharide heptosyltransferase I [Alcanivorax sp.]HCE39170.1 lipopolysaccharide heptosyltransferase I [Alcanivorax sp.]|tara:strand:- start:36053 stop:37084 length:1032 start_codon:yes stop_codon:yes gene_type:complete
MHVLLIKTSSMGDVIHTLPALTDAAAALPGLRVDWVVEAPFADLAGRHPAVDRVLPSRLREWRRHPLRARRSGEWGRFKEALRAHRYDAVIDAQGLIKSAFVTRLAHGPKFGLDRISAREGLSARVLDHPLPVPRGGHAVTRVRTLFALALGYPLPDDDPDYGLVREHTPRPLTEPGAELVFCHGTTWPTKHYPEAYWRALAEKAAAAGHRVNLPWGNDAEHARAERLARDLGGVTVLPRLSLSALTDKLLNWDAFIAVDTGLAHLAAAAGLPGVGLYGPTDPRLTGVWGPRARSLAAEFPCAPCVQEKCTYRGSLGQGVEPPCFSSLKPHRVWQRLIEVSGP